MTRVVLLALACSVACNAQLGFDSWSDEDAWLPTQDERMARRGAGVSSGPGSLVASEASTPMEGQGVSTGPGSVATVPAEELANPVERDTAKIVWKVTGLNYTALTLDADLRAKFSDSQVQLIIDAWGTDGQGADLISAEQVEVKLSAGSVVVDIAVQAAANQTVDTTDIKVPDPASILSAVAAIDGIDSAKCVGCELSVEEPSVSLYKAGSTSGRAFLNAPVVAVVPKTTGSQLVPGPRTTSFLGASASASASASIATTPSSTETLSRGVTSTDVARTQPSNPDLTVDEAAVGDVSGASPHRALSGIVAVLSLLLAFTKL